MEMYVCQKTHLGHKRSTNQDDMGWFSLESGELFILTDGMGGVSGGRTAAKMTKSAIRQYIEANNLSIPILIKESILNANKQVFAKGHSGQKEFENMGTTVVVLFIQSNIVYWGHVGDSRLYLFRDDHLLRLTKDHSVVQDMIDSNVIEPDDAMKHPDANKLTQAVGPFETVEPSICDTSMDIKVGDIFMMCSDGLSGLINDHQISQIIRSTKDCKDICESLVQNALGCGGHDNITVQCVYFTLE